MVLCHYVVVDGERYFVPESTGIEAVSDELLQAVHSGGAYVSLGVSDAGYTDVLVTSSTPIRIEHVSSDDDDDPTCEEPGTREEVDPGWWL